MSHIAQNAYLNTRVAAKATQLLERSEVQQLAQFGLQDLGQRFEMGTLLEEPGSVRSKSRAIEQSLIQVLLAELTVLVRPMRADERQLVLAWARKYALFNLKTLLRGKIHQLDAQEIRENLYDLPPQMRLAKEDLFRAENAVELLRTLERGPLSLLARQAREIYEKRQEAFALEATIDQRYYSELARRVTQVGSGEGQRQMKTLVGALVDRANILWLLRFRFKYQLSSSETFYQLVPSPHLMHRDRLLHLVGFDDQAKVLDALPEPLRGRLAEAENLMDVQRRLGQYLDGIARHILRHGHSGLSRALAYLILRESDLRLIFTLMQGRLLNLPQARTEMALGLSDRTCAEPRGKAA